MKQHRIYNNLAILLAATGVLVSPHTVYASSDEAWAEFAKDVSAKCLKAAGHTDTKPMILVDAYGSDSFGFAIVSGKSGGTTVSRICVVNKKTGATEMGSELEVSVKKTSQ